MPLFSLSSSWGWEGPLPSLSPTRCYGANTCFSLSPCALCLFLSAPRACGSSRQDSCRELTVSSTYCVPGSVQFTLLPDFTVSLRDWVSCRLEYSRTLITYSPSFMKLIVLFELPAYWHTCPRSVEALLVLSFLRGRCFSRGRHRRLDSSAPSILAIGRHLGMPRAPPSGVKQSAWIITLSISYLARAAGNAAKRHSFLAIACPHSWESYVTTVIFIFFVVSSVNL